MVKATLTAETDCEIIDVKFFDLEKHLTKYTGLQANGWNVIVEVYETPEKKSLILNPYADREKREKLFLSCVGLVIKVGKGVYMDDRYKDTGPWCEIGDFVLFPRNAGYGFYYNDKYLFLLKEDMIDAVVDNPNLITFNLNS